MAIGVIGVVMIAAAVFRAQRKEPAPPKRTDVWRSRAAGVCAAGREIIDLSTNHDGPAVEGGLTIARLSDIEAKLDLLIAQIHDVQATAPTPEDSRRMQIAELHASSLKETVSTIRRWRLKSASSAVERLDTLALQLSAHRSALDDALREISKGTGER